MANRASDLIAAAEALYGLPLNPNRTGEIRALLQKGVAEALGLYANLIMCDFLNQWNDPTPANKSDANKWADRALELAPDTAIAHYAKAFYYRSEDRHGEAVTEFTKSLAINPDSIRTHAQKANEHLYLGEFDDALNEINQALALSGAKDSPALGMFQWIKGRILFFKTDYGAAISCLEESIKSWPNLWYNRLYLVSAYAHLNQTDKAEELLSDFWGRFPGKYRSIAAVKAAETATPSGVKSVKDKREIFHQGLAKAKMPQT